MLARLIELQVAEHFFEIRENNLRSGHTIRSLSIPRNETIRNMFSWRICTKISDGRITSQTLRL